MSATEIYMYATGILAILFTIEQVLAQIPSIKSNSIFQVIYNVTKALVDASKKSVGKVPPKK